MIRTITLAFLVEKDRTSLYYQAPASFGQRLVIFLGRLVFLSFRSGLTLIPVRTNRNWDKR